MKKIQSTLVCLLIGCLLGGCSAMSPSKLFEPLQWLGEYVELSHHVLDCFPLGNGRTVTAEIETIGGGENRNLLAYWEQNDRKGELTPLPLPSSYIDGFIVSDYLYLTYVPIDGGAVFSKIDLLTLDAVFSVQIPATGSLTAILSFPSEDGFVVTWGTKSVQSWTSIDFAGSIVDTTETYFDLPYPNENELHSETYGNQKFVSGETTYLSFGGNLLVFANKVASYIPSQRILGFAETADMLSYYYCDDRENTLQSEFILNFVSGSTEKTVVTIQKSYLGKTRIGSRFFFRGEQVFVTGTTSTGINMLFVSMLIYDRESGKVFWTEYKEQVRPYSDDLMLIDDYFYWFEKDLSDTMHEYWRAQIPPVL